jgi:penicillin-binding protein 1C
LVACLITALPSLLFLSLLVRRGAILEDVPFSNAYFSEEGVLLKLYPATDEQYRLYGYLSSIPSDFLDLILLQEDEFFYCHPGVNPISLARAFRDTYILKTRRIGGSTLTMQTAHLLYGIDSSHIPGKIEQILRAFGLELVYSKSEILETYVNLAPCGGNIMGFPAASEIFFGKPLNELSLSEWALLAVLPQDPQGRDPRREENREEVLAARNRLYERWASREGNKNRVIYHESLLPAVKEDLPFMAPHLMEMLQQSDQVRGIVNTSLNVTAQRMPTEHLQSYIDRHRDEGVRNGAALILDYRTMEVQALSGSADFFNDEIQGMVNGTSSRRSPGSTLKPFIYGLAMDQGLIHSHSILYDRPISFSTYAPDNYQRDFKGPVSAWNALVNSRNIPAVELASKLDNPDLYSLLKNAPAGDLMDRDHYGLSLVLGSGELSMLELAGLYAALGNGGQLRDITAGGGFILQDFSEQRILSPQSAYIVRKMLERNPAPGEGFLLSEEKWQEILTPRIAYKTGTSIGFKDAWSIGLYGPYVVAVWIGNFSGEGNPAFLGREIATPLLFEVAAELEALSPDEIEEPLRETGLKLVDVCSISGCLPSENCEHTVQAYFIPGVSPIEKCTIHRSIIIDKETGYRVEREGDNTEKVIREIWPSDMQNLFEEAGIPRPISPPYEASLSEEKLNQGSQPPRIISPLKEAQYIFRPGDEEGNRIPLTASADGEVKAVFWFVDGRFLGRSDPRETLYWSPTAGTHRLILLDDKGLSADRTVEVFFEP